MSSLAGPSELRLDTTSENLMYRVSLWKVRNRSGLPHQASVHIHKFRISAASKQEK